MPIKTYHSPNYLYLTYVPLSRQKNPESTTQSTAKQSSDNEGAPQYLPYIEYLLIKDRIPGYALVFEKPPLIIDNKIHCFHMRLYRIVEGTVIGIGQNTGLFFFKRKIFNKYTEKGEIKEWMMTDGYTTIPVSQKVVEFFREKFGNTRSKATIIKQKGAILFDDEKRPILVEIFDDYVGYVDEETLSITTGPYKKKTFFTVYKLYTNPTTVEIYEGLEYKGKKYASVIRIQEITYGRGVEKDKFIDLREFPLFADNHVLMRKRNNSNLPGNIPIVKKDKPFITKTNEDILLIDAPLTLLSSKKASEDYINYMKQTISVPKIPQDEKTLRNYMLVIKWDKTKVKPFAKISVLVKDSEHRKNKNKNKNKNNITPALLLYNGKWYYVEAPLLLLLSLSKTNNNSIKKKIINEWPHIELPISQDWVLHPRNNKRKQSQTTKVIFDGIEWHDIGYALVGKDENSIERILPLAYFSTKTRKRIYVASFGEGLPNYREGTQYSLYGGIISYMTLTSGEYYSPHHHASYNVIDYNGKKVPKILFLEKILKNDDKIQDIYYMPCTSDYQLLLDYGSYFVTIPNIHNTESHPLFYAIIPSVPIKFYTFSDMRSIHSISWGTREESAAIVTDQFIMIEIEKNENSEHVRMKYAGEYNILRARNRTVKEFNMQIPIKEPEYTQMDDGIYMVINKRPVKQVLPLPRHPAYKFMHYDPVTETYYFIIKKEKEPVIISYTYDAIEERNVYYVETGNETIVCHDILDIFRSFYILHKIGFNIDVLDDD